MHVCNIVIIIILQAGGGGACFPPPSAAPDSVIQHITICILVMEGSVVNSPMKGQNMKRL